MTSVVPVVAVEGSVESRSSLVSTTSMSSGPEISADEIVLGRLLGEGSFGKVYRATLHQQEVAVKIPFKQSLPEEDLEALRHECKVMAGHTMDNVCRFMGACTVQGSFRIVTELLDGNVYDLLYKGSRRLTMYQRLRIAEDTARGMIWLENVRPPIIHRDLKPENLLFKRMASGDMVIKVADFGLSSMKHSPAEKLRDSATRRPKGTPLYMSPEVMLHRAFDEKTDVYSFGIMLWEILHNEEPFPEHREHGNFTRFSKAITQDRERPVISPSARPDLADMMRQCWAHDPRQRPDFKDIAIKLHSIILDVELAGDPIAVRFWRTYSPSSYRVSFRHLLSSWERFMASPGFFDVCKRRVFSLLFTGVWHNAEAAAVAAGEEPSGTASGRPIKAATLNRLVMHLTSKKSNPEFMKCFLMCYQSFTSPDVLLGKLLERFNVPATAVQAEGGEEAVKLIQLSVVNVVKHWLSDYPDDFSGDMRAALREWMERLERSGHRAFAAQVGAALGKKRVDRAKQFDRQPPKPMIPKGIFSSSLQLQNVHPDEIARQLCLYEFEIFQRVRPSELLNLAWSKPKLKHRSPNVLALIECFNCFSQWGAFVVMQHDAVEKRAKALAFVIKLADALFRLNNFDSTMALLAALNSASLGRLKHTYARLPPSLVEKKRAMEAACSREMSHKAYRAAIASANPPVVPYLGLYLTDLVFVEEGNSASIKAADGVTKLIHFNKAMHTYRIISNSIQRYQDVPYNFMRVHQVQTLFHKLPTLPESELYRRSLSFEPRGADPSDIK